MSAIYNEIDPYAVQWLKNLSDAGHVATGSVDSRSITELQPSDVAGPGQRHFFAGIGVWSYALRLAGVSDDAQIWTGSCPCQPFSVAGRKGGLSDSRHLWPEWFRLIRVRRPAIIFGEQVASPDGLGWFDAVSADLEAEGYTVGSADICAAGVGAPHLRQRLYFVAYSDAAGRREQWRARLSGDRESSLRNDAHGRGADGVVGHPTGLGHERDWSSRRWRNGSSDASLAGESLVGDANDSRSQGRGERRDGTDQLSSWEAGMAHWSDCDWIPCSDGKIRPVEPGSFPLAHGATARVGRLRAYGNAIVPQVAATFIRAALGL